MNSKLIKLSENYYIIVDDSEIQEGDYFWSPKKRSIEKCVKKSIVIKGSKSDSEQYKIIYSTESIDEDEGGSCFITVKQLCLTQVKKLLYGYELVELSEDATKNQKFAGGDREKSIAQIYYRRGFKAHQAIVKNKLFTFEDMKKALYELNTFFDEKGFIDELQVEAVLQEFLPKTSWQIEIDNQGNITKVYE